MNACSQINRLPFFSRVLHQDIFSTAGPEDLSQHSSKGHRAVRLLKVV